MAVIIKSAEEITAMRRAGAVVASMIRILSSEMKVGMITCELDEIAMRELGRYGAMPSFLWRDSPADGGLSAHFEKTIAITDGEAGGAHSLGSGGTGLLKINTSILCSGNTDLLGIP